MIKIPNNTLWQYLEKEHLDIDDEMTDEQWELFVNDYNDSFADTVSNIGHDLFKEALEKYNND